MHVRESQTPLSSEILKNIYHNQNLIYLIIMVNVFGCIHYFSCEEPLFSFFLFFTPQSGLFNLNIAYVFFHYSANQYDLSTIENNKIKID